jgi:hypothetical protein
VADAVENVRLLRRGDVEALLVAFAERVGLET